MPEPIVATKEMVEQIFDGAAPTYNRTGPDIFTQFGIRLVELMSLAPGAHVLDVATGTGAVLLPAARQVGPRGRATGIDLSGAILDRAERAVRAEGLAGVELLKMDAEQLQFPDETFDAVTCAFALFLFPDADGALAEMYRVCKPGGSVGVTMFDRTVPPFDPGWPILMQQFRAYGVGVRMPRSAAITPEELAALLTRPGFHSVQIRSEASDVVYANEDDWWAFQLTLGSRATIQSMDEEIRERFRQEYLAKLRPLFRQDGLHLSVAVLYGIARR
jgi:O-methyltransferase/aklanonic acid methyltransferase